MRWFTSDLHLGHVNIINYTARPFHHVAEMNAALVANWNSVVLTNDEVWVLGDLAMGRIDDQLPLCGSLLGRKILVVGNHDRPFADRPERAAWSERYAVEGGFERIAHGDEIIEIAGTAVRVCHFPFAGTPAARDPHVDQRPADDGGWLLHGHVHTGWRQRERMINVGVDAWAGFPVPEDTIAELISTPAYLDPLDWHEGPRTID